MRIATCKICGKEFEVESKPGARNSLCSPACRLVNHRRGSKIAYQKRTPEQKQRYNENKRQKKRDLKTQEEYYEIGTV